MDSKDIFNQMKISYYLGNYSKAIELWKTNNGENFGDVEEDVISLVARSYLILDNKQAGEFNPLIAELINAPEVKKLFEETRKYLVPLLKMKDVDKLKQLFDDFEKAYPSKTTFNSRLIQNYLAVSSNQYQLVNSNEKGFKHRDLELHLAAFLNYLKVKRLDLAEKKYSGLTLIDEEDITSHFAHLYLLIYTGKFEECIDLIDEIKEKFQESVKLYNLKAVCLIALKQYANASVLLSKLQNLLTTKDQAKNDTELEICLTNIILANNLQGLPVDDEIKLLQKFNPEAEYFKKQKAAEALFDSLAV